MLCLSRELLRTLLKTDQTLTPNIRILLTDLADGKLLPAQASSPEANTDRLIAVTEAAKLLNIGRSTFYVKRALYPELSPIEFGGRVSFSYLAIQSLIRRLKNEAVPQHIEEEKHRVA